MAQQFVGSGQWLQFGDDAIETERVLVVEGVQGESAAFRSTFTQEFANERFAAHPNAAMDRPCGKDDSGISEGLVPSPDMFVDAIDERTVQIKEEGRGGCGLWLSALLHRGSDANRRRLGEARRCAT